MKRPRHWIKLWVAWLDNPAHRDLSEGAFGLGPLLLLMCTWDGTYQGGGWLLAEDGSPMTSMALMRETHRDSRGRLNAQLAELIKCKTMVQREDGAFGFPNYGKWQETKAAERMRLKREREREQFANSSTQRSHQTTDDRDSLRESPPTPTVESKPEDPLAPATKRVLAHLNSALVRLGEPGKMSGKRFIRARLADGADEADLCLEIDRREDECRTNKASLAYLNTVTPFRPEAWEANLARARAWKRTRGVKAQANGRQYDATPDEVRARLAAAGEPEAST